MPLYKHKSRPEWGTAQLISEANGKRTFLFTDRTQRSFLQTHWGFMIPIDGAEAAPSVPAAPGPPGATDMRALAKHGAYVDGSAVTDSLLNETPPAGQYGNTGYWLLREVLGGWIVGAREQVTPALTRVIELIEHGRAAGERWGNSVFHIAQQAEALALAYWLRGEHDKADATFLAAAVASQEHFDTNPKERRTHAGNLLLRFIAAREPQRGLDALHAVKIPKPRADPEDLKTQRQNRYWDSYGKTMETLAEELIKGAPKRAIYDKVMKYVAAEIGKELERNDYGFVDVPRHIVLVKAFAGDLMGVADPELAIAMLYLLAPTVRQPPRIAALLAKGPLPR